MDTAEKRVAYINAQIVCAQIEAMGMVAENKFREYNGLPVAYKDEDFSSLINKYGIRHNAVIEYLREV